MSYEFAPVGGVVASRAVRDDRKLLYDPDGYLQSSEKLADVMDGVKTFSKDICRARSARSIDEIGTTALFKRVFKERSTGTALPLQTTAAVQWVTYDSPVTIREDIFLSLMRYDMSDRLLHHKECNLTSYVGGLVTMYVKNDSDGIADALLQGDVRALTDTAWHPATAYETDDFLDEMIDLHKLSLNATGR